MGSLRSSWQIGHEFPASTISSFEGGEPYCCETKKKEQELGEFNSIQTHFKIQEKIRKELPITADINRCNQTSSPTPLFCVFRDPTKPVPIHAIGETGMAQRWEHSPATKVAWVRVLAATPYYKTPYTGWIVVGSLSCSERFLSGFCGSPSPQDNRSLSSKPCSIPIRSRNCLALSTLRGPQP